MRGVIFDLDGTLADSLRDIAEAVNYVLAARGLPGWSQSEIERMVGEGARVLIRRALGPRGEIEDEVLAAFHARYRTHAAVHTRPYDGVDALLHALAARRTPMAVLSNKPQPATGDVVRALFPRAPFVEVRGAQDGRAIKPDPSSALELARRMELAPQSIFFVGDTPIDVETAARAGMISVGVLWGMRSRRELEEAGARHLIAAPDELLGLLQ